MLASLKQLLETSTYPVNWPGHWIAGKWQKDEKSREEKTSFNPSQGSEIMRFTTSKKLLFEAINEAHTQFPKLQEITYKNRMILLEQMAKVFNEHKELIAQCMQVEVGKPAWEAYSETEAACNYLKWAVSNCEQIEKNLLAPANLGFYTGNYNLNPVGVTVAHLPFSTPTTSFAFYFAAALISGCPLILISSTQASLCSLLFSRLAECCDLPRGIFGTIFGGFSEFRLALTEAKVKAAIFTGSKEHCDKLRKEFRGFRDRQLLLQSGGKNSALVHSSADINKAVISIIYGACKSAGQLCSSTSRVFIFRSLLPEFKNILNKTIASLSIGPTDNLEHRDQDGPQMGPLYSKKSVEKFLRFQTMAQRDASETINWGCELELSSNNGFFVNPGIHILDEFDKTSAYQDNILFSPDIAIYSYDVLNDAVSNINATDSCLSVSFFGDPHIIQDRSYLFHAPNLLVNSPTTEVEASLPLAGRSLSSHHRYHGPALAFYLSYPQVFRDCPSEWEKISTWL